MVSFSFKDRPKKPKHTSDEDRFSRRSILVGGLQAVLGTTIMARLLYLTSFQNSTYAALSDDNRIKVKFLMPKRGVIHDRKGRVMADNRQTYRLMVTPDQTDALRSSLKRMQQHVDFIHDDIDTLFASIHAKPKFVPSCIADGLSWQTVCHLEVILRDYPGYSIEQGWMRHYPYSFATAHIVGYVQIPSKDDQNATPLYRLSDFRIGKTGLEKAHNDQLKGQVGIERIEVNSTGRTVKPIETTMAQSGQTLQTTIDLDLQTYIQDRLTAVESASAVVMDIHSGAVLSLVSAPTYDANLFTNGISTTDWNSLLHNPRKCLHNKAIHGLYPPGSLFKMIVALAAFDSGLVSPSHTSYCTGHMEVGTQRFHCWHKHGGHGRVDIVKALYQSCDIYFYELSQIIGHKRIEEMARRFGFGTLTGIELPNEQGGLIPTEAWMKTYRKRSWLRGDTANMSIGQGALLATPVQMTAMMASLVNPDGYLVTPTVCEGTTQMPQRPHNISAEALKKIQKGLAMTVNDPRGLAYRHRIEDPLLNMAGKTATCQVRRITLAERKKGILHNDQRPWEHRDHALFCGYAPLHNPRFATAIVVEHGGSGGRVAAPIGRDILLKTQTLMKTT